MHPILFRIGPVTLHAFGALMALGFLAALFVMRRLARGGFVRLNDDQVSGLIVWLMAGGVLGARLAYVLEHWSAEFADNPGAILRIDQGGLMFYGGVLGAIAAVRLYARRHRRGFLEVLDLCAVGLPLGHAFGRLGCFLNGCCHGRICEHPLSVRYPAGSIAWREQLAAGRIAATSAYSLPVLPTQLIEMGANLILFAGLYRLARRHPRHGTVTAAYLLLYAVIRFATESLRGDPRMAVGPLSISQFISVLIFGAGLGLAGLQYRRARIAAGEEPAGSHPRPGV